MKSPLRSLALLLICGMTAVLLASCGGTSSQPAASSSRPETAASSVASSSSSSSRTDEQNSTSASSSSASSSASSEVPASSSSASSSAQSSTSSALEDQIYLYRNTSLGFFLWNASDSKSDITEITAYLTGTMSNSVEVKPDLTNVNDAVSYQNFKASVYWIDKCNEMRQRENVAEGTNLQDLKINDYLMMAAEIHADYSGYGASHHVNDAHGWCAFPMAENVAHGYSAKTDGTAKDGPFNGWYTYEKKLYQSGITDENKIGHYQLIVSNRYTVTGFAICTKSRDTCVQQFTNDYYGSYGKSYTTAQYKARLSQYEAYIAQLEAARG